MPFRFDDDTFFGPNADRIISNQEDQHTIQIISFPGRKVLWRYGHVNQKGSAQRLPEHARRRVPAAERARHRCRRVQLPRPLHQPRAPDRASVRHDRRLQAQPAVRARRDQRRDTARRRRHARERDHRLVGRRHLRDRAGCAGRSRRPCRIRRIRSCSAPGRILLADYARPGHVIIMTRTGRVLWRYGPPSGRGRCSTIRRSPRGSHRA